MAEKSLNLTFPGEFEGPFLKQSSCCHTCLLPLGARPNDVMSWRRARLHDVIHPRGRLLSTFTYPSRAQSCRSQGRWFMFVFVFDLTPLLWITLRNVGLCSMLTSAAWWRMWHTSLPASLAWLEAFRCVFIQIQAVICKLCFKFHYCSCIWMISWFLWMKVHTLSEIMTSFGNFIK